MLKKYILFATVLFGSSTLVADPAQFDVELSQGYRRERLDFTISGPHGKPNILSELKFKKMDIYVTRLGLSLTKDDYFLKGIVSYGKIYDGKTVDDDYFRNNRKVHFSHSTHDITGDYTADCAVRFGKHFGLTEGFTLSPHIGYSAYTQKVRYRHGKGWALHPFFGRKSGKFHGLNSTYRANWYAPELGLGLKKAVTTSVNLFANYTLLFPLKYHGKGHWNLREEGARHFDLHNKSSKSFGNIAGCGVEWAFIEDWTLKAEYEYMKFYAKDGHVRTGKFHQPLHRAHLTSSEVRLTVAYAF